MSRHTEPRHVARHRAKRGVLRSRSVRGLLSLGILLGIGGVGSLAYWSDEAAVSTGTFTSGTLDVTLNDGLAGQGGTTGDAGFALTDMVPGESLARTVKVGNAGSIPLTYTAKAWNEGALGAGLRWTVVAGSTASNSGNASSGNRTGSCSSGATTANGITLGTSAGGATTVVTPKRPIAAGSSENVCVIAKLDAGAGNGLQGQSASATIRFDALQVGAP